MSKIFFFRHIINNSVIISKTDYLSKAHLPQVGLHRSGMKMRRDHWTPFLLFESNQNLDKIYNDLYSDFKYPIGKIRYPLPIKSLVWTIPEEVESKILKLHSLLENQSLDSVQGKMYWERLEYQKLAEWPGSISHDKLSLKKSCITSKAVKTLKTYTLKTSLEY